MEAKLDPVTGATPNQYITSETTSATLLAHLNTYAKSTNIAVANREYNELKHLLDEHNQQREETAIELETLEESFRQEKTIEN